MFSVFPGLNPETVTQLFFSPTVYHDINSKFKRTTLCMKKQNEGTSLFIKYLVGVAYFWLLYVTRENVRHVGNTFSLQVLFQTISA